MLVVPVQAAAQPAVRALGRARGVVAGHVERGALVEHEREVGSQRGLDLHGGLGRHEALGAVEIGAKAHAALLDGDDPALALGAVGRAALDLVGDDRPLPAHELVQSAEARDALVAGIEEQVEGVAEDDVVPEGSDLGRQHPLDRRLGRQGHEGGRADLAVGGAQHPGAGPRAGVAGGDGQGRHREHARSGVVIAPLATFLDVAQNIGLPVVFLLVAIETMGIPVPGETALITAGIVASRGHLSIEAVIAVAAAAAILGDNVGFAIGRKLGRRALTAPGPFLHHRRRVIAVGEPFFDRHGPKAVFLGRWVTGLRITAAWMAGVTRMSWPTFLFWNALGGIAWATSIGLLAYFVGHSAEKFIHLAGLGGAVVVVLSGVVLWFVLRTRRRRAGALVEAEVAARIEAEAEAEAG